MYYAWEQINRECQWWLYLKEDMKESGLEEVEITVTKSDIDRIVSMIRQTN